MSNQNISLKAKLKENPIFVETIDGKKFAELKVEYNYTVSGQKGSEVNYLNSFEVVVNEDLISKIQKTKKNDYLEINGIYRRVDENNKARDTIFATDLSLSKGTKSKAMELEVTGNLVLAPEVKESLKGNQYFRIAVATNIKFKNKNDKEIELITFYNLLFVGDIAETNRELQKGEYVKVKGNYEIKPYKTKDGKDREDKTIFVKEIEAVEFNSKNIIHPDELKLKTD